VGCKTGGAADPRFREIVGVGGGQPAGSTNLTALPTAPALPAAPGVGTAPPTAATYLADRFRVGDILIITFADLPYKQEPIEDRVRDDGTIKLLQDLSFNVAEKKRSEVEKQIHEAYVPKYYKTMSVTVQPRMSTQFYSVDGEVKRPDRQVYLGRTSVLRAIASAGGFTDFAHRTAVILTRADGRKETINCLKAQRDHRLDPEIFPGDSVFVYRKNPFQR
jgi:polysaccharide export outer membrane protein